MTVFHRLAGRDLAIGAALFVCCFAVWWPLYTDTIFISGGADYLRSAKAGFWSEYLDLHSTSLVQIASRYRRDAEFRRHPWRAMDQAGSDSAARHFHVAEGLYLHAALESAGASARAHRIAAGLVGAVFIAALFLLLRYAGVKLPAALLTAAGLPALQAVAFTYTDIDGHDMYLAWAIGFLVTLSIALEARSVNWWMASLVCLAGAAAAIELAPLLIVAAVGLLAVSVEARRSFADLLRRRPWWWSPLIFALALFVFWPGGVLNGGYVVSYVSYIYIPLFRAVFFSPATPLQLLLRMTDGSVLLIFCYAGMFAMATIAVFRQRRRDPLLLILFLYTLLMAWQGHRNKLTNPTYVAEFLAPLWIMTGVALDRLWTSVRPAAAGAAAALFAAFVIGLMTLPQATRNREETGGRISAAMAALRTQFPAGACFLAPVNYEPLILYMTGYRIEIPVSSEPLTPRPEVPPGYYVLVDRPDAGETAFAQARAQHPLRPVIAEAQDGFWVSQAPVR